jgi:rubrerythrin
VRAPVFTAREVLQFAVKNEQDGEALYRKIAKLTAELAARKLFLLLAKEEVRHLRIFRRMLSNLDETETIRTNAPDEYAACMIAYYTADILFSANRTEELPPLPDVIAALDFGIRRELDSMTYYVQAKQLVPAGQAKLIDKIIEEERGHFLKFSELKWKYLAKDGSRMKRRKAQ